MKFQQAQRFILAAKWDGKDRIASLLNTVHVAGDATAKADGRELVRQWLDAAVATLFTIEGPKPGVLVVHGPQGCGKDNWFRQLAAPLGTNSLLLDTIEKSQWARGAAGTWLTKVEMFEFLNEQGKEAARKIAMRPEEPVRAPYELSKTMVPAPALFATVDDLHGIDDMAGQWVLQVEGFHPITVNMQKVFAQVLFELQNGRGELPMSDNEFTPTYCKTLPRAAWPGRPSGEAQ